LIDGVVLSLSASSVVEELRIVQREPSPARIPIAA
jgi:hypothetical protein